MNPRDLVGLKVGLYNWLIVKRLLSNFETDEFFLTIALKCIRANLIESRKRNIP